MAPGKEDPKTIFSEQVLEELIQRHRRHQLYIHPYHQLSHELLLRKLKETHSLPEVVDSESHPLLKATPSVQTEATPESLKELPDPHPALNWLLDYANALKPFLGTNILVLPYAFALSGIWPGIAILIFCTIFTELGVRQLLSCKRQLTESGLEVKTLSDINHAAFSSHGELVDVVVKGFVVFVQLGVCIGYIIFCGQNIHLIVPQLEDFLAYLLPAVCVGLPLVLIPNMRYMAPLSLMSDVAIFTAMGLLLSAFNLGSVHDVERAHLTLVDTPVVFGIAMSAYSFLPLALPLEQSMHNTARQPWRYSVVLDSTLLLVNAIFLAFGLLAYFTYGPHTDSVISNNLSKSADPTLATLTAVFLVVAVLFTYPIQLFPVCQIVDSVLTSHLGGDDCTRFPIYALSRLALTLGSAVLAFIFRQVFGLFYGLIGALGCSFLGFILPAVLLLKLQGMNLLAILSLLVGLFLGVSSSIASIYQMTSSL